MRRSIYARTFFLILVLAAASTASILLGHYNLSLHELLDRKSPGYMLVYYYRVPRTLAAILIGAALAVAGAVMQGVFRNPLAGPSLLGVVQGAAFGISMALLLSNGDTLAVELSGFAGGMAAVALTITIASRIKFGEEPYRLILAGIAVSALFASLVSLAKFMADPYTRLQEIVYWLLGSIAGISWSDLGVMAIPLLLGVTGAIMASWWINILSLGDEEAQSLGVNTRVLRLLVLASATVGVSAATAVAGIISWVGLISPHIARLIYGYDNRYVVAGSALVGAVIVLLCDTAARVLLPYEVPLGITTSMLSVAVLIALLIRKR